PCTFSTAYPSLFPLQLTIPESIIVEVNTLNSSKRIESFAEQKYASHAVRRYKPAPTFLSVSLVSNVDHKKVYGGVPLWGCAIAIPVFAFSQRIRVSGLITSIANVDVSSTKKL